MYIRIGLLQQYKIEAEKQRARPLGFASVLNQRDHRRAFFRSLGWTEVHRSRQCQFHSAGQTQAKGPERWICQAKLKGRNHILSIIVASCSREEKQARHYHQAKPVQITTCRQNQRNTKRQLKSYGLI